MRREMLSGEVTIFSKLIASSKNKKKNAYQLNNSSKIASNYARNLEKLKKKKKRKKTFAAAVTSLCSSSEGWTHELLYEVIPAKCPSVIVETTFMALLKLSDIIYLFVYSLN